ncbi:hypothetical protein Tco_1082497 [Tanacetum coccineum]|uniref:Uncharacterized protein n=1 Tax=Tanacetum coccineum TaxID=301880 RepID=A0ABQ5I2Q1_9ASTR
MQLDTVLHPNNNNSDSLKQLLSTNIKLLYFEAWRSMIKWSMEMEHLPEYNSHDVWKAIPKEHMRRFHGMDDAKRKGSQSELAHVLKYQLRMQIISFSDLCPAWSNLAMTMRTKPEVDTLSIDDLYNNLRVFEQEIQGASKTSSSAQNVAFVLQSESSSNKVKSGFTGAYSTCTPSTKIPEKEVLADSNDCYRMKKFYKKTGRRVRVDGKTPVSFDKRQPECFNVTTLDHFIGNVQQRCHMEERRREELILSRSRSWEAREESDGACLIIDDGIVIVA